MFTTKKNLEIGMSAVMISVLARNSSQPAKLEIYGPAH